MHPADRTPAPIYDYSRLGRHRLRAPSGAIVDLPVPFVASAKVWVATIWPDPAIPGGWARQMWHCVSSGRGWELPYELAAGDVIEFGADTPDAAVRWYGIMDSYELDRWATFQGPYAHPAAAHEEAQRLLALERYAEPLLSQAPAPSNASPRRRAGRRHLGRHGSGKRGSNPL